MLRRFFFWCFAGALCVLLPSVPALAAEVDCDAVYCFRAADFSEREVTGICVTDLPDTGALLLAGRTIRAGDVLTGEQAGQLSFVPVRSQWDRTAQIGYLPVFADHVGAPDTMTIHIRGKADQPPVAEDSAAETYKNMPGAGKLKASDPEGQPLTYTVVRQPKRGSVAIGTDGSFTYTPKKNKVGVDSFSYTATDAAGNVSREATVTITILKPTSAAAYTDTDGRDCRFAAEWMKHSGIFVGESLGEQCCFQPDKTVTRGEFVTMLVKALDIPTDEYLTYTGYTDEIPRWLQPYLAAAIRAGLTVGLADQETFGADCEITVGEARILLENSLAEGQTALPVSLDDQVPLTREAAAELLYQAARQQSQPAV